MFSIAGSANDKSSTVQHTNQKGGPVESANAKRELPSGKHPFPEENHEKAKWFNGKTKVCPPVLASLTQQPQTESLATSCSGESYTVTYAEEEFKRKLKTGEFADETRRVVVPPMPSNDDMLELYCEGEEQIIFPNELSVDNTMIIDKYQNHQTMHEKKLYLKGDLTLNNCPMTSVWKGIRADLMVTIKRCHQLKALPEMILTNRLVIDDCRQLETLPKLMNTSRAIKIDLTNLPALKELPDWMTNPGRQADPTIEITLKNTGLPIWLEDKLLTQEIPGRTFNIIYWMPHLKARLCNTFASTLSYWHFLASKNLENELPEITVKLSDEEEKAICHFLYLARHHIGFTASPTKHGDGLHRRPINDEGKKLLSTVYNALCMIQDTLSKWADPNPITRLCFLKSILKTPVQFMMGKLLFNVDEINKSITEVIAQESSESKQKKIDDLCLTKHCIDHILNSEFVSQINSNRLVPTGIRPKELDIELQLKIMICKKVEELTGYDLKASSFAKQWMGISGINLTGNVGMIDEWATNAIETSKRHFIQHRLSQPVQEAE